MKLKDKLIRDWKKDRETLKTLNFRQRLQFILDYYRGQMFILFVFNLLFLFTNNRINIIKQPTDSYKNVGCTSM